MEAIEYWRSISRSTLLEPKKAGKFAITFKMDAKKNDGNEHEKKKSPLTSMPLFSRPHSLLFSLLFSPSKSILFYASTDWHQSGKYRKLLVSSAIFIIYII